ncbi:DUF3830 family protein [Roseomonas fluvialis]|uniref:Cyclophilin-like superfamily protein n=1 Tax=Roseomonas fluvialis TaxID=1750527 RepID=A0ABM7Y185_9PROT|nr:DUF3830 family protein [Roseomonas fluvialis]BDG71570.1 hypothetical protein Rmf_14990 [Roseomonas fluvialis]
MADVIIDIGGEIFEAVYESKDAPKTVARFCDFIPYSNRIIHVRWSGEACWIPMGDYDLGLSFENATSHPAPGHVIVYPGGVSETEILIAYGPTAFASKAGPLAGNHVLTITGGLDRLAVIGRSVLWDGAKPITFRPA